jgi:hypothetical protein
MPKVRLTEQRKEVLRAWYTLLVRGQAEYNATPWWNWFTRQTIRREWNVAHAALNDMIILLAGAGGRLDVDQDSVTLTRAK